MANTTKRAQPDRSKIAMDQSHEVAYWTKHLGVNREELQKAIAKVGNSAAAVKKQLGVKQAKAAATDHQAEDEVDRGDICSPQSEPSTNDDEPLE